MDTEREEKDRQQLAVEAVALLMVIEMRGGEEAADSEDTEDQGEDFEQVFGNRIEGLVLLQSKVSVKCSFGL